MDTTEAARVLAGLRPRATLHCHRCGGAFIGYADTPGKYCSPRCRQAAWVADDPDRERRRLRAYRAKQRERRQAPERQARALGRLREDAEQARAAGDSARAEQIDAIAAELAAAE